MTGLLAEALDTNNLILQIVTLVCAMVTAAITAFMSYKMAQLKTQQESAAVKVQEVKESLKETNAAREEQLSEIAATSSKALKQTNGVLVSQLGNSMKALQRVAELTGNEEDVDAAKRATAAYDDHIKSATLTKEGLV